jgi:hypothetical protein
MWALVIFTVAANGASTVATLDFATQNLCLLSPNKDLNPHGACSFGRPS